MLGEEYKLILCEWQTKFHTNFVSSCAVVWSLKIQESGDIRVHTSFSSEGWEVVQSHSGACIIVCSDSEVVLCSRSKVKDTVNSLCGLNIVGYKRPVTGTMCITILNYKVQYCTTTITPGVEPNRKHSWIHSDQLWLLWLHWNCNYD